MKEKLKMYLPIIIMLVVALTAGILIWLDILHVDQIIAAVNDNRPLAALVILALFAFKGCSCIPYAVILIGCALIFELPVAIAINTVGTAICISVSYLIGRFSKGLTFEGMMEKYPKFRRYFPMPRDTALPLCFCAHAASFHRGAGRTFRASAHALLGVYRRLDGGAYTQYAYLYGHRR